MSQCDRKVPLSRFLAQFLLRETQFFRLSPLTPPKCWQARFSLKPKKLFRPRSGRNSFLGFNFFHAQLLRAYPKTQIVEGATLLRRALYNLGFRFSDRHLIAHTGGHKQINRFSKAQPQTGDDNEPAKRVHLLQASRLHLNQGI
jgi:hypothetical protein